MELPNRKRNRLENGDYSAGSYFITICVSDRKRLLGTIVGTGVPDCPKPTLYKCGRLAEKYILQLNEFYENISVDKYVIMPDHIHLLISIYNGQSGTPVPTMDNSCFNNSNSAVAKFVSTFKRFFNKEYGENIWQSRYYDHIIRNKQDYEEIWNYIDNNPISWILKNETRDE